VILMKCVVSINTGTGMGLGPVPDIRLADIFKNHEHNVYDIQKYHGESLCFCSPECTGYIDAYPDSRKRASEILTSQSYLTRDQFDVNVIEQVRKHCRPALRDFDI
jgi:hypothetical protein